MNVDSRTNPISEYVSYLLSQSSQSSSVSTPIPNDNACPPPACSNPEKTSAVDHLNVTPVCSSSLWTFCETNMTMCTWEQRDTCVSQSFVCPDGCSIIKSTSNQVRKTKSGLSQTYKCSGFRRYGCQFQMKMEQNLNSIVLQISTRGSHTHSYETAAKKTGTPPHLKGFISVGFENMAKPGVVYRIMK